MDKNKIDLDVIQRELAAIIIFLAMLIVIVLFKWASM